MNVRSNLEWNLLAAVYRPALRRAANQIMAGRVRDEDRPEAGRFLPDDVEAFLDAAWGRARQLRSHADLDALPNLGNRHNVCLAVLTTAAYQTLLAQGVGSDYAATLVADIGWKVYRWMLMAAALPIRFTSRDPRTRMERTLRGLLRFPFSAPGRPGYEVDAWSDGSGFHTHWTHCPPQSFVRKVIAHDGDHGELDAFYRSWCQYDWPGADVIANDGARGHYRRLETLARGDAVCDMCWSGVPLKRDADENDVPRAR